MESLIVKSGMWIFRLSLIRLKVKSENKRLQGGGIPPLQFTHQCSDNIYLVHTVCNWMHGNTWYL
jgi:hypothetical protein